MDLIHLLFNLEGFLLHLSPEELIILYHTCRSFRDKVLNLQTLEFLSRNHGLENQGSLLGFIKGFDSKYGFTRSITTTAYLDRQLKHHFQQRNLDFLTVLQVLGATGWEVILKDILQNCDQQALTFLIGIKDTGLAPYHLIIKAVGSGNVLTLNMVMNSVPSSVHSGNGREYIEFAVDNNISQMLLPLTRDFDVWSLKVYITRAVVKGHLDSIRELISLGGCPLHAIKVSATQSSSATLMTLMNEYHFHRQPIPYIKKITRGATHSSLDRIMDYLAKNGLKGILLEIAAETGLMWFVEKAIKLGCTSYLSGMVVAYENDQQEILDRLTELVNQDKPEPLRYFHSGTICVQAERDIFSKCPKFWVKHLALISAAGTGTNSV